MERATIKDVARVAGVSPSAVSRVFSDGGSASTETREKVKAAAERLGYRPSLLARGLVSKRTSLVTLVTGPLGDPFDAELVECLADALAEDGIRLLLTLASSTAPGGGSLLHALDYQSDAVVVSAGTMPLEDSAVCVKAGLPVILVGRVLEAEGVDCVLADNRDGGRQAADLLLRTGCRHPAYLGLGKTTFSDRERLQGFGQVIADAGLPLDERAVDGRDHGAAFMAASDLLCRNPRPDGLFCSNDSIAIAAIEAARALGIAVPEQLSVVGFNNLDMASWQSFQLTTLDYPVSALAGEVMDLLKSRLDNPKRADETRRLVTRLVVRGTTRRLFASS